MSADFDDTPEDGAAIGRPDPAAAHRLLLALRECESRAIDAAVCSEAAGVAEEACTKRLARVRKMIEAVEACAVRGVRHVAHYMCATSGCKGTRKAAVAVGCGKRICPECVQRHRARTARKVGKALKHFRNTLFVTLTIKSGPDLAERMRTLAESFTRLTRRKWWRDRVENWIACMEITRTESGWHPHLHIAVDAPFLPWSQREAWERCHGRLATKDDWTAVFFGREMTQAGVCALKLEALRARSRRSRIDRKTAAKIAALRRCCKQHSTGLIEQWSAATRGAGEPWGQSVERAKPNVARELVKYIAKFLRWDAVNFAIADLADFVDATMDAHFLRMSLMGETESEHGKMEPCPICQNENWRFAWSEKIILHASDPPESC